MLPLDGPERLGSEERSWFFVAVSATKNKTLITLLTGSRGNGPDHAGKAGTNAIINFLAFNSHLYVMCFISHF